MTVPVYEDLMRPMLELIADGEAWATADIRSALAEHFELTKSDLAERIPSGSATRFSKNVDWARHYLKRAGVVYAPDRGMSVLTARGRDLLVSEDSRIDSTVLRRYDEFRSFKDGSDTVSADGPSSSRTDAALTPDEVMSQAYLELRQATVDDLLGLLLKHSPEFFERAVLQLLERLGYGGYEGASQHLGGPRDDGVDGVIWEDRLQLDAVYIQANRWRDTVGRSAVQAFVGSLEGQQAQKGVLITTSTFSKDARDYVKRINKRIVLVAGQELAELMYDNGLGVATENTYEIRRLDTDFFAEDN